ncbi:MAG TPA: polyprenyl synthetase family protein [Candidatus Corynebacterium avicola]|uniref:Polyprenyl synthetase family protein n=1 Tax=Candidatus Corynebacterium avicola TaxID=2838527 RepID=A0A9D1RSE7_9CORY|nr:polyprenyl synthetase family protein [Candidatus Corynebacterium avicola]
MADTPLPTTWAFDSPLTDVPAAVDARLDRFLTGQAGRYDGIDPVVTDGIADLAGFMQGGKRVRPLFAWAGVRAVLESGAEPTGDEAVQVLDAVSSLEFIQACALVHDDIIDHSDTRRGRPTVHRTFEARHRSDRWNGSAADYGVNQAILVGDLAFAWADDMLADAGIAASSLARAREPWRQMRTEVVAGQMLDISLEASGSEDPAGPYKVNTYKTAAYTVERPLHLGAALAGGEESTVTLLREVGRDIGIAFQLQDDHLGVFGDPAVTGKASGDDLRSGKRTHLLLNALRLADAADPEAAARLRAGVGSVTTEDEVDALRQIIVDSGAAQESTDHIRTLTDRAVSRLQGAGLGRAITEELIAVAHRLTERRS